MATHLRNYSSTLVLGGRQSDPLKSYGSSPEREREREIAEVYPDHRVELDGSPLEREISTSTRNARNKNWSKRKATSQVNRILRHKRKQALVGPQVNTGRYKLHKVPGKEGRILVNDTHRNLSYTNTRRSVHRDIKTAGLNKRKTGQFKMRPLIDGPNHSVDHDQETSYDYFKLLRPQRSVVHQIMMGMYETPSYHPADVTMRSVPRQTMPRNLNMQSIGMQGGMQHTSLLSHKNKTGDCRVKDTSVSSSSMQKTKRKPRHAESPSQALESTLNVQTIKTPNRPRTTTGSRNASTKLLSISGLAEMHDLQRVPVLKHKTRANKMGKREEDSDIFPKLVIPHLQTQNLTIAKTGHQRVHPKGFESSVRSLINIKQRIFAPNLDEVKPRSPLTSPAHGRALLRLYPGENPDPNPGIAGIVLDQKKSPPTSPTRRRKPRGLRKPLDNYGTFHEDNEEKWTSNELAPETYTPRNRNMATTLEPFNHQNGPIYIPHVAYKKKICEKVEVSNIAANDTSGHMIVTQDIKIIDAAVQNNDQQCATKKLIPSKNHVEKTDMFDDKLKVIDDESSMLAKKRTALPQPSNSTSTLEFTKDEIAEAARIALQRSREQEEQRRRKRDQIQMIEEDHVAYDLREFNAMRQEYFGPQSDEIRKIGGWKTVPIFISSTFRDMHGERDMLTREVFPALNERCKRLHINVIPVDLRWGLTAEQCEVEGACQLCLKEIELGRPFFLGMLGSRYGWIPPTYGITSEDASFDWCRNLPVNRSITEMEILHGFLWPHKRLDDSLGPKPAYAFMYFRDPSYLKDVPEHLHSIFEDNDDENRRHTANLKERIRQYPCAALMENYPCEYDKASTDEKPMVKGLESFRDHVLEDLWSVIKIEYSLSYAQARWDYHYSERFLHNLFMIEKAQQFEEICPLPELMDEMMDALHGATESGTPLLVTGDPGIGMTTALAAFTVRYKAQLHNIHRQETALVFTHFVGNSANFSTDLRRLLLRMCSELNDYFDLKLEIPETLSRLKRCLGKCLVKVDEAAKARKEIVYILLDHVERLLVGQGDSHSTGGHPGHRKKASSSRATSNKRRRSSTQKDDNTMFEWLPTTLSDIAMGTRRTNIHFILSAESGPALMELSAREYPMFALMPLKSEQSTKLIESSLKMYRKTLTNEQMQGVLAKHKADNPLYICLFCEELRLHGLYGMAGEGVDMKIKQLPGEINNLVQASLERIEHAVGWQLVTDCLGLICASHHGLNESELLEMLGSGWDGSDTLPRAIWAQLQQNISFIVSKFFGEKTVYKIVHNQFLEGVRRRYLNDPGQRERIYDRLVDFYRSKGDPLGDHSWSGDNQRAFRDIVYYQIRMGSRSLTELHDTLCNLYFIEKRCALDASAVYDLTADFETVLDILRQNTAVVTRAIRRQRFLGVKRRSMQAALQKQSKLNSAAQESSSGNGSGNDVETATKANLEAVNHATSLVNDTNTSLQNSQNSTVSVTIPDSTTKIQPNTRTPAQLLSKAAHVFNMQGRVRGLKRLQPNAITITEEKKQEDADRSREFFRNGHVLNMPEFPTDTRDSHAIKSFVEQLLRRLSDFLHMVRSQSHVLAVSPSLTFQLALTQSPSCGPYLAAQKRIDACMTPSSWIEWVNRPEQDLKLVDRVANSRCNCVAVSVEIAAVGFEDSSIQIIAIENLKVRQELHAHDDGVTALAWARTLLASGDRTGRIIVWNTYNFSIVYNLDGHQGVINDLDFSDEGRHLVSVCNDATMRIWSTYLEDYDEIQTVWDRSHVSSLTAVAYFNKVCSSSRSRRTLINRSGSHNTDTKLIACGAASGKVVVWDASALSLGVEIIFRLHCHTREVNGLDFNHDASLLCSGSLDHLVGIWDMKTGTLIRTLQAHVRGITSVKFSSAGDQFFSAGMDNILNIWQVNEAFCDPDFEGEHFPTRTLRGHSDTVSGFVLLNEHHQLMSVSHDRTIKLWNVESGTELDATDVTSTGTSSPDKLSRPGIGSRTLSNVVSDALQNVNDLANDVSSSPTFKNLTVSTSGSPGSPTSPGHGASTKNVEYHSDRCCVCALSNSADLVASGSHDATVKLWSVEPTLQLLSTNRYHVDTISALAFSPDGKILFSGSDDQSIIISQIVFPEELWRKQSENRKKRDKENDQYVLSDDEEEAKTEMDNQSIGPDDVDDKQEKQEGVSKTSTQNTISKDEGSDDHITPRMEAQTTTPKFDKSNRVAVFTLRQKHKIDLHASRVVDIKVPSNRTVLSADIACTVILWSFVAGDEEQLLASRDHALKGPYRVNTDLLKFVPLIRLDCTVPDIGVGLKLNLDMRQQLVVVTTNRGKLHAWSLKGIVSLNSGNKPAVINHILIEEAQMAEQQLRHEAQKRKVAERKALANLPFSAASTYENNVDSSMTNLGLAQLSQLKSRVRTLAQHHMRYKGLLMPRTRTVVVDMINLSFGQKLSSMSEFRADADADTKLPLSKDNITSCDTSHNHKAMLIGFDSGRLAMYQIAFKGTRSNMPPSFRKPLSSPSATRKTAIDAESSSNSEEEDVDECKHSRTDTEDKEEDTTDGMELNFFIVNYVDKGAFQGHSGPITSVRFNPNGRHCVSTSEDRHLMVWACDTGMRVAEFVLSGECYGGVLGLDGSTLICGDATGQLCHLMVKWKAPGSLLLEKVLRVEYVKFKEQEQTRVPSSRPGTSCSRLHTPMHGPNTKSNNVNNKHIGASTGPRVSRGVSDTQSALGLGIVQLCDWYTSRIASQLHEMWREARPKEPNGTYMPRIKIVGGHAYDIANLTFRDLPEHYQYENMQAATVACNDLFEQVISGGIFDEEFIYKASISQHQAWISRNAAWAPASQLVPFDELSQEEKDKDTVIVLKAMKAFEPYMPFAGSEAVFTQYVEAGQEENNDKRIAEQYADTDHVAKQIVDTKEKDEPKDNSIKKKSSQSESCSSTRRSNSRSGRNGKKKGKKKS